MTELGFSLEVDVLLINMVSIRMIELCAILFSMIVLPQRFVYF